MDLSDIDLAGTVQKVEEKPVAQGGFSDIYLGLWTKSPHAETMQVAVKVIVTRRSNKDTDRRIERRLNREISTWRNLDHPGIIKLYGISSDFGKFPALVSPWYNNGDASRYLKAHPGADRHHLLRGAVAAVQYLHGLQPAVVHGDIKAANLLVKDNGEACLGDFGLSRFIQHVSTGVTTTTPNSGTPRWMAPELLFGSGGDLAPITKEGDVYALGCLALEAPSKLTTDEWPWYSIHNNAEFMVKVYEGHLPPRPENEVAAHELSDELWSLITSCWSYKPTERPQVTTVHSRLLSIIGAKQPGTLAAGASYSHSDGLIDRSNISCGAEVEMDRTLTTSELPDGMAQNSPGLDLAQTREQSFRRAAASLSLPPGVNALVSLLRDLSPLLTRSHITEEQIQLLRDRTALCFRIIAENWNAELHESTLGPSLARLLGLLEKIQASTTQYDSYGHFKRFIYQSNIANDIEANLKRLDHALAAFGLAAAMAQHRRGQDFVMATGKDSDKRGKALIDQVAEGSAAAAQLAPVPRLAVAAAVFQAIIAASARVKFNKEKCQLLLDRSEECFHAIDGSSQPVYKSALKPTVIKFIELLEDIRTSMETYASYNRFESFINQSLIADDIGTKLKHLNHMLVAFGMAAAMARYK
ncbi:hypothetical protein BOTBODRAFT_177764 [Botryobasidium botryosum FD-172 SS1]|uniref:Protein kinase domain-containing protein n=1 Tax=Botryobasidium botryosum (strain FD-172 SS1) TaxID=930990 RepID=A0A067MH60_BOTB1|nr:hypothetical protein BOTBODRAFT_177764 [Botryobasidium botryosum FD-172 SS1]